MDLHPAIAPERVAVITGGASGIGFAAARALGAAGMRLAIADISQESLEAAAADLRSAGYDIVAVRTDVGSRGDIAALKAAADRLGQVSLLMNNAGRAGQGRILGDPDVWEAILATNMMGPLWGIQAFLPDMLAAAWSCAIVNTGSKQGITLPPGNSAYNVSKAGLKALTELLAHDLLDTHGRVTAHLLIPGFTYTGLIRAAMAEKPPAAWTPEQVVEFMLPAMARGDFYILCPDNEVTREMDEKRIAWAAGDIIENRPALSRWHPDFGNAFKAFMEEGRD
jgi:NAD(P)-dependent dehydrogenase (short-subunit alcohol dehydrogenase family)